MDEAYRTYIKDIWKEAEEVAINDLGGTSNSMVIAIFDKMCQPYYYWKSSR